MQTSVLHREHVRGRGDAGSTLMHDLRRIAVRGECHAQLVRSADKKILAEVVLEPMIARAGNVPGDRVDGFILTREAIGGASVEKANAGIM